MLGEVPVDDADGLCLAYIPFVEIPAFQQRGSDRAQVARKRKLLRSKDRRNVGLAGTPHAAPRLGCCW